MFKKINKMNKEGYCLGMFLLPLNKKNHIKKAILTEIKIDTINKARLEGGDYLCKT